MTLHPFLMPEQKQFMILNGSTVVFCRFDYLLYLMSVVQDKLLEELRLSDSIILLILILQIKIHYYSQTETSISQINVWRCYHS